MKRFQVYKAKDGYRWRYISENGKLVAESGESYKVRAMAVKGFYVLCDSLLSGNWIIDKDEATKPRRKKPAKKAKRK